MDYLGRARRLRTQMKAAGVDGLLVTHPADVRYLSGFTGSNATLLVLPRRVTLFTDGRYTSQAAAEVHDVKVVIASKPATVEALEMAVAAGIAKCGFDATETTVADLQAMRKILGRKRLVAVDPLIANMRQIKDQVEIECMRDAAALGCRLFEGVLEDIVPGATEMEVALALEFTARLAGAQGMSFDTIVAGGERSALPHGRATNARLARRGFCTLDFGVVLDGYCSDMTRTVHLGKPRKGEREVYEAVLEAQEAGIASVRAGVTGAQVDEATRSVLRNAALADFFTHSTGHGLGLEIHEAPRLAARQNAVLQAGMVVTIEPGVYLPGNFGVRIEDTVLVTKNGCEILTPITKAWIEL